MRICVGILTFVMLGMLTTGAARDPTNFTKQDFDKFEGAYLDCLAHPNPGVVESALYCVLKLHHDFPDQSFHELSRAIADLSTAGPTPQIRYKANLATVYLNNRTLMDELDGNAFQDPSSFWVKLVTDLEAIPPEELRTLL